ncbi:MAG TPA: hypothetical protein VMH05_04635 [Bryobacteraceae bacterium]|nr:hypothetical protein [Bryobacteraceae bacterium]
MFIFHLFRSLLPPRNPIGFGAADFIELAVALLLVLLWILSRPWIEPIGQRLAQKMGWSMLLLALLPAALRLALAPHYPIPTPAVSDDFSYLLLADTLRHFRLANPAHPFSQFFETFFVLQQPSYSSVFPLGQGLMLAIGWTIFGHPWAGVALSEGAFCALCYWMLRAWTTPGWALAGGLLAVIEFGPLNQWMNSYWGGAVSAMAGCLVFGSLPQVVESGRRRYAALLGLGMGVQIISRPFESIFLLAGALLFFLPALRSSISFKRLLKLAPIALAAAAPALALMFFQNRAVTGSWTTMPNMLSREQYGVPTSFTVQPLPVPSRQLTHQQQLDFEAQSEVHGPGTDTFATYWDRLWSRVRFYRFFLLAPLYLALPFFLARAKEFRFAWVLAALLLFALGTNFYPYFYSHYIAALACLFVLMSVAGLEGLSQIRISGQPVGLDGARIILLLCAGHFLFWYGLHAWGDPDVVPEMRQYETWDGINHGDPDGRIAINHQLDRLPGKQLVFVRYSPRHQFVEWVHNPADIDSAHVVWARDLGAEEDQKLRKYYPARTAWLLEPDARPPTLTPYPAAEVP